MADVAVVGGRAWVVAGTRLGDRPAGGTATVADLATFRAADPTRGELPALMWGTVPASVAGRHQARRRCQRDGRRGRARRAAGQRWPAVRALLPDNPIFTAAANRLDLYQVGADGGLRRLTLS
ncbi:hypothetical protein M8C17_01190 [Micromonospora sp. RHAY321]|uniref:hypothetical protein n=1 Tax=Micromonospora sp. RHAY321 TaxID=2944807 RepID=UPI00207C2634|nr:hypothetical protein [Micromonospora sp. RHAY321]MCO1593776.1 hypothetical protein [Micromonospora sp. RHAY321]